MLRNKLGKPSTGTSVSETSKATQVKSQGVSTLPNTGIKLPQGPSTQKPPFLTPGFKPTTKPPIPIPQQTPTPQSKPHLTGLTSALKPTQTLPSRPTIQTKTQQQRLAELVNKKAAQMKKQYQMISKMSAQVDKKSYFKEYDGKFRKVLGNRFKREGSIKDSDKSSSKQIMWRLNQWDKQNQIENYIKNNFKPENYL